MAATWTANNRACTTLWTTLYNMTQLVTNFDDSGELKMKDLTYYNPLASAEMRRQAALMISDQLDNIFRIGRGAKYEKDIDRDDAITGMMEVLEDENKTVKELASVADKLYRFWGEKKS